MYQQPTKPTSAMAMPIRIPMNSRTTSTSIPNSPINKFDIVFWSLPHLSLNGLVSHPFLSFRHFLYIFFIHNNITRAAKKSSILTITNIAKMLQREHSEATGLLRYARV
jgi:hypothetical protein